MNNLSSVLVSLELVESPPEDIMIKVVKDGKKKKNRKKMKTMRENMKKMVREMRIGNSEFIEYF